tara:strand:+ start:144 stop:476 length:333 start_codon:yes stop_codon:yes gene_type:complete
VWWLAAYNISLCVFATQIDNLPPAWKELFKRAGVHKADLKDPKTSLFILETIAANISKPPPSVAPAAAPDASASNSSSKSQSKKAEKVENQQPKGKMEGKGNRRVEQLEN